MGEVEPKVFQKCAQNKPLSSFLIPMIRSRNPEAIFVAVTFLGKMCSTEYPIPEEEFDCLNDGFFFFFLFSFFSLYFLFLLPGFFYILRAQPFSFSFSFFPSETLFLLFLLHSFIDDFFFLSLQILFNTSSKSSLTTT